jgi:energy-converting hydrogenase Eha subunit H
VLELFCTGQIYLPTLMAVWTLPGHRARALGYLLLYDAAFLLPLLGVLGLVCAGTGTACLAEFSRRRLAAVKLALALFFLGLTGYLGMVSVALWQ